MIVDPDDGRVVITLADVYRQLVTLSTKVDASLASATHLEERVADHEGRIRAMEKSRWPVQSLTILIALCSLIVAIVAVVLKN